MTFELDGLKLCELHTSVSTRLGVIPILRQRLWEGSKRALWFYRLTSSPLSFPLIELAWEKSWSWLGLIFCLWLDLCWCWCEDFYSWRLVAEFSKETRGQKLDKSDYHSLRRQACILRPTDGIETRIVNICLPKSIRTPRYILVLLQGYNNELKFQKWCLDLF